MQRSTLKTVRQKQKAECANCATLGNESFSSSFLYDYGKILCSYCDVRPFIVHYLYGIDYILSISINNKGWFCTCRAGARTYDLFRLKETWILNIVSGSLDLKMFNLIKNIVFLETDILKLNGMWNEGSSGYV